ncbi:MAG TPA: hypothetical protein VN802_13780 [Stellaceae bacterium]|nr:hypothetical protein [Stellaceae bacterium]
MPFDFEWTDVTTAIVAGAVMLILCSAGYAAWRSYRHELLGRAPVMAPSFAWRGDGAISVEIAVRNRLAETPEIVSGRVLRPKGMGVAIDHGDAASVPSYSPHVNISAVIDARGKTRLSAGKEYPSDAQTLHFHLFPPQGWRRGRIKLELRISSRADTLQHKRKVIAAVMPAP